MERKAASQAGDAAWRRQPQLLHFSPTLELIVCKWAMVTFPQLHFFAPKTPWAWHRMTTPHINCSGLGLAGLCQQAWLFWPIFHGTISVRCTRELTWDKTAGFIRLERCYEGHFRLDLGHINVIKEVIGVIKLCNKEYEWISLESSENKTMDAHVPPCISRQIQIITTALHNR